MILKNFRSKFAKDVLKLTTGTVIAQALSIGFLPILTRLFTPEDFGLLTLYVALTSVLAAFATLRLEHAIILSRSNIGAAHLLLGTVGVAAIFALILFVVVAVFGSRIAIALGTPELEPWLFAVPASVLLISAYQGLRYWSIRRTRFGSVANAAVAKALSMNVTATALGVGSSAGRSVGLVLGQIAGDLANMLVLLVASRKTLQKLIPKARLRRVVAGIKRYRHLVATLLTTHGAASIYSRLPVFGISTLFGSTSLGFFGLAERVTQAPFALIAGSIGDVYRQRATVAYQQNGRFDALMLATVKRTALIALPLYALGIALAPTVFAFVFGESWREAGEYAAILLVGGYFSFVSVPVDKAAIIVGAYRYIVVWHTVMLLGNVSLLAAAYFADWSVHGLLIGLVVLRIALFVFDLGYEYRLSKGQN